MAALIIAIATGASALAALSTTRAVAERSDRAAPAGIGRNLELAPSLQAADTTDAEIFGRLADGPIAGPVAASVIRIIDGDTLLVDAAPWPQQTVRVYVRIRGIDAPELHARCASERAAGLAAKRALEDLVPGGRRGHGASLALEDISGDKYFGRVVARVRLPDRADVGERLLHAGLARPYDGGRKQPFACKEARAE